MVKRSGTRAAVMAVLLGLAPGLTGACTLETALPQGGDTLRGYARPGDSTAPAAGQMRAYRVEEPALVQALRKLDGEGDITAAAAGLGVTPKAFMPAAESSEKRQQPNRIYRYEAAGQAGVFVTFVANDQPEAALAGQLFCQLGAAGQGGFASILLGGIEPAALPEVINAACQAVTVQQKKNCLTR